MTIWSLTAILTDILAKPDRYAVRINRRTKEITIRQISDAEQDLRARTFYAPPQHRKD